MTRQHFGIGIGGVLSLVVLTAAIVAARPPGIDNEEQAGSLAAFAEVPRQVRDPFEQQARTLHEQLKTKLTNELELSRRDAELKKALDRYFAESKIEQAIQLLEAVVSEADGTPEASKASAAIRVLNGSEARPPSRDPLESNLGDYPTMVKPVKGMNPNSKSGFRVRPKTN